MKNENNEVVETTVSSGDILHAEFSIEMISGIKADLANMSVFVAKKSTIPILQSVKIEASESWETIRITGTDSDDTLIVNLDAKVHLSGAVCVELESLKNVFKSAVKNVSVKVWHVDGLAENRIYRLDFLVDGRNKFSLAGQDVSNFPIIEAQAKKTTIKTDGKVLTDVLRKTSYAITNDYSRFTLNGICLEFGEKGYLCAATDGHRLSIAYTPDFVEANPQQQVLFSQNATKFLQGKAKGEVKIGKISEQIDNAKVTSHIQFSFGKYTLICRTLSGRFPNYKMVIPKESMHFFQIKTKEVAGAVLDALAISDVKDKAIKFQPIKNNFVVKCESEEQQFETVVSCGLQASDTFAVMATGRYLLDVLKATDESIVNIEYKDSKTQFQLTGQSGFCKWQAVIMPCWVEKDKNTNFIIADETIERGKWNASDITERVKVAPKYTPSEKKEAVANIEKILNAMNQAVSQNEMSENFKRVFSKGFEAMQKELQVLK